MNRQHEQDPYELSSQQAIELLRRSAQGPDQAEQQKLAGGIVVEQDEAGRFVKWLWSAEARALLGGQQATGQQEPSSSE